MTGSPQAKAVQVAARSDAGLRAYLSGVSAEQMVARLYDEAGYDLREFRWRSQGGEIDLIVEKNGVVVFVEVKKARTFDAARDSLRPVQMRRIHAAASKYLECLPAGQLSEVRFDLAMVDDVGRSMIEQNAFGHF